jgi:hypothetical protein
VQKQGPAKRSTFLMGQFVTTGDMALIIQGALPPHRVVKFYMYTGMEPITGTITKVHFDGNAITYDLELWLPQRDGGKEHTRVYNIESHFVQELR